MIPNFDFLTASNQVAGDAVSHCGTPRKCRLFAVAACRHAWPLITDEACRELVAAAERFADGLMSEKELTLLRRPVHKWAREQGNIPMTDEEWRARSGAGPYPLGSGRWEAIWGAYNAAVPKDPSSPFLLTAEYRPYAADIFGNPFQPVTFAPEWRTDTATAIARQVYESRDFSAMPILADALQDAGCNNNDILNHCRDPQATHVPGCWVVDLVLGKE